MIEKIQHATASSPEGAKGLVKGVLACAFQNMAFMLPTGLLYLLVKDLLEGSTSGRSTFYLVGCVACFVLILLTTWFQYNGTYFTTYKESGTRRLTLAERLRKLPLSFFGKRDLADLTSTIMADCEVLEKDCSHFIPGLFGSLISTVLIALSLFAFDGRMALAAAKLANYEEFDEKLPDKWNTNIGENGCALSGGERQRISIARAFLKDAPIILLDEATASLDVENETAIQEALSRLIKNKTVLIIAHRMRTVAGADQVVVLSGGIVAEQGSPAELYARKGLYTHMVDLQSASQNWTI